MNTYIITDRFRALDTNSLIARMQVIQAESADAAQEEYITLAERWYRTTGTLTVEEARS